MDEERKKRKIMNNAVERKQLWKATNERNLNILITRFPSLKNRLLWCLYIHVLRVPTELTLTSTVIVALYSNVKLRNVVKFKRQRREHVTNWKKQYISTLHNIMRRSIAFFSFVIYVKSVRCLKSGERLEWKRKKKHRVHDVEQVLWKK